jgi:UDP-glucose 4-epimerase
MADRTSRVLVTGGAGYIGSHTVLALREAGYEVAVVDDLSTGDRSLLPQDVSFHLGDVADRQFMAEVLERHEPGAVLHFAGSIIAEESVRLPLKYYMNNTAATMNLLASCVAAGVPSFIFSSTAAIYGAAKAVPIPEDALPAPVNPYGTSKWMIEQMLTEISAASPLRTASLRYFNVAGADPAGRTGPSGSNPTHLIRLACQAAIGMRPSVSIFGTDYDTADGTCVRDYLHVADLASAHIAALERLSAQRRSFTLNVGYGRGFSVREVLNRCKALGSADFTIREEGRRAGDIVVSISDNRRILAELAWTPRYDDLDVILKTALAWERTLLERAQSGSKSVR